MVVRDSSGSLRLSAVTKTDKIQSSFHAELKAILFGLEIACTYSFSSLTVENDSLLAFLEIKKYPESLCEWGSIVSDIKDLSAQYELCEFHFVRRSANVCAHNIAKLPCDLGGYQVWRNSLPPNLCNPDYSC